MKVNDAVSEDPNEDRPRRFRRLRQAPGRFLRVFHPLNRGEREAIGGFFSGVWRKLRSLPFDRELPPDYDFDKMLDRWGIHPDQVDQVRRNLLFEVLGFALVGLLMFAAILVYPAVQQAALQSTMVLLVCVVGFLTRLWRFELLRRREWIPFKRWLIGG